MNRYGSLILNLTTACVLSLALVPEGVLARSPAYELIAGQLHPDGKLVRHTTYPNQPVEVTNVSVKGKNYKLDEEIGDAGDDWLDGLFVAVKNVSGKTITHISIYLDFPDTRATGTIMAYPLHYGCNPRFPRDKNQPQALAPRATAAFTVSGPTFTDLKTFIENRQSLAGLEKVTIHVSEVYLDDGRFWSAGSWFRLDPGDSTKYSRIEDQ